MCLAVERVLSEEKGSTEEDDAGDEPTNEKDGYHELLILTAVTNPLYQLEVGGRQLLFSGLTDRLAALVRDRHC